MHEMEKRFQFSSVATKANRFLVHLYIIATTFNGFSLIAEDPAPAKGVSIPQMFGEPKVVETDEYADRTKLRSEARALLRVKNYDGIEKRAAELRTVKEPYPNGRSKLAAFYMGFFEIASTATDMEYDALIANLKDWIKAKPNSITARVSLARAWRNYAWRARGAGFADSVSEEHWEVFDKRLAEARAVLAGSQRMSGQCPGWHAASLSIALGEHITVAAYETMFEQAIKAEPSDEEFYFSKAHYITPIWYGKPGDAEKFVERSADRLSGEAADMFYARMVWSLRTAKAYTNIFKEGHFSWPRTKAGFEAIMNHHPHCLFVASEFCYEAAQANDRAQMRKLLEREIRDQVDIRLWVTKDRFVAMRRFAYANAPKNDR